MRRFFTLLLALWLLTIPPLVGAQSPTRLSANPPGTLLPAGATSTSVTVTAPAAANCRYAVGSALPFDQMTATGTPRGTRHTFTINGLSADPNTVNQVYVRCDNDVNDALNLRYRSVGNVNPGYPRTGNLWGWWNWIDQNGSIDFNDMAKIDLWLGAEGMEAADIAQLRRLNPNVLVLTSYNAVEALLGEVPDHYFLKGADGRKIEVWPGAYRVNLTLPEVQEYQAQVAYRKIADSGFMYDGVFIDNVFVSASWFTQDIYGVPFQPDADNDGIADDPAVLDAAWRAGLMNQLRRIRELLPGAILNGHAQDIDDPEMAAMFNGTSIGFDPPYVIEGRISFAQMWQRYVGWLTTARAPRQTMVESALPLQIGYGYDYEPESKMPPSTLAFARDYYPYMRFGLAFTLMGDGYFAHEIGDTWHGNRWWYDELDFDLGQPLGGAQFIGPGGGGPNLVSNGDFSNGTADWEMWVDTSDGGAATYRNDGGAARIDITAIPSGAWQIDFNQRDRAYTGGQGYTLTFRARADRARTLAVASQKGSPDWRSYGLYDEVYLTTDWQTFSVPFTATETVTDARMQFFLGGATGTVWIDDVSITTRPADVLRRDYTNGIVLLNATNDYQTIQVGPGFRRLTGAQAPRHEYIVDDASPGFSANGWTQREVDSGEWKATGPFFHDWGPGSHYASSGEARWDLGIREPDTYTVTVWWAAAPEASGWNSAARYEIVGADGAVLASATFDQRTNGDQWHQIGQVPLTSGAFVRLTCPGGGVCSADALHVRSAARYNDGTRAETVTLQPMDGIILARGDGPVPTPPPTATPVASALLGDIDQNGSVTLADFSLLAVSYNLAAGAAGYNPRADLNRDRAVTLVDFSLLAGNFNCALPNPELRCQRV
jgi:hypothetical protein